MMTNAPAALDAASVHDTPLRYRITTMSRTALLQEMMNILAHASENAMMYERFRAFVSSFHQYSFFNRLMLFVQYPMGSQFAGSKQWKDHGRMVMAKEKSCRIYKPRTRQVPYMKNGVVQTNKDGTPQMIEEHLGFSLVPVFAYEQTAPMNDQKEVIIPSYQSVISDDPYKMREALVKVMCARNIDTVFRNLEFAHDHVTDGTTFVVNQLYDISSQNYTIVKKLCSQSISEMPQASWKEQATEFAALIVGMAIGTPRTLFRPIDLLKINDQIAQTAIKAVDDIMKEIEI